MILPGIDYGKEVSSIEIAKKTIQCLKKNVPDSVPGIAFYQVGSPKLSQAET